MNSNTNKREPLVSIIIPAYNVENYIDEAILSALSQTYKNIEVVIINDGSTDNTEKVVNKFLSDNRIKYIKQENKGLSNARNNAIKKSKGEYIALLDADDVFMPKKIEKQVKYLETYKKCDISYCNMYHFYEDTPLKLLKLQYKYYSGDDVLPNLINGNFIAPLAVVIRKDVFDKFGYFDEKLNRSEDLEFWIRIALNGGVFNFLSEILAKLRIRKSGNLQDFKSQPAVKQTNFEIIEKLYDRMGVDDRKKYKLNYYCGKHAIKTAVAHLINGDKKTAYLFITKASSLYSFSIVSCIVLYVALLFPSSIILWIFKFYYKIKQLMIFTK